MPTHYIQYRPVRYCTVLYCRPTLGSGTKIGPAAGFQKLENCNGMRAELYIQVLQSAVHM